MMPDSCNPSFLPYWNRDIDTGEITGYFVDLLEELSRSVGFNYTLEDSSEFTHYDSLGKMTKKILKINKTVNVVNGLASNKFDLAMGDFTITPERTAIIDFTVAFQTDLYYIKTKIPKFDDSTFFSMFKPLSLEVWIAIFVSLITGIVSQSELSFLTFGLIFIVVIIFGLTIKMNTGKNNALSISLWLCIDALLGQGLDEPPR